MRSDGPSFHRRSLQNPHGRDVDKWYNFALITSSESGTWIYKGGFCVREKPGGGTRVALLKEDSDPCPRGR
ncbi:hypothetical protein GNZ24_17630 [Burkholderia thailandensis]|nr:hypothetical protein A8H31_24525 [Burkholderia thailandensis]AWY60509.1 hypothetical protein A8H35_17965 [Burkholderia thailandensis]AWY69612.1 hypothetical protein A8H36_29300 [Burkholderia thailandensis]MUV21476.1 hypothetical protein [Burkholderia thailandensis]MUV28798.1 hypothetical protein [Burkholderia thailandensis]